MSLERFPKLDALAHGRPLYFEDPPSYIHELQERGYKIVFLSTLPRDTQAQEQDYLRAKLRGVEEGTVKVDKLQLLALQSALNLAFGSKEPVHEKAARSDDDFMDMFDWKPTRFKLKDNTTIQERPMEQLTLDKPEEK